MTVIEPIQFDDEEDYEIPEHLRSNLSFMERADNWLAAMPDFIEEMRSEDKPGKAQNSKGE